MIEPNVNACRRLWALLVPFHTSLATAWTLVMILGTSSGSAADTVLTRESLAMPRQRIVLSDTSLRAFSQRGAASPRDMTVCGVKRLMFPPAVLYDYRFGLAFREHDSDTLILDKTGTLTDGAPTLHVLIPDDPQLLRVAGPTAAASIHPIARAITAAAGSPTPVSHAIEVPGRGIEAPSSEGMVRIGRASWLAEHGLTTPAIDHPGPGTWVARGDTVIGYIGFRDAPRPHAADALAQLRRLGISRLVLLTGDRSAIAEAIAAASG